MLAKVCQLSQYKTPEEDLRNSFLLRQHHRQNCGFRMKHFEG